MQAVTGSTPGWIRTSDFCLRRAALYPLSYGRLGDPESSRGAGPRWRAKEMTQASPKRGGVANGSGWHRRAKLRTIRRVHDMWAEAAASALYGTSQSTYGSREEPQGPGPKGHSRSHEGRRAGLLPSSALPCAAC